MLLYLSYLGVFGDTARCLALEMMVTGQSRIFAILLDAIGEYCES